MEKKRPPADKRYLEAYVTQKYLAMAAEALNVALANTHSNADILLSDAIAKALTKTKTALSYAKERLNRESDRVGYDLGLFGSPKG